MLCKHKGNIQAPKLSETLEGEVKATKQEWEFDLLDSEAEEFAAHGAKLALSSVLGQCYAKANANGLKLAWTDLVAKVKMPIRFTDLAVLKAECGIGVDANVVAEKDAKIAELEAKVKAFEEQLKKRSAK
jgi:hypothetical protein